MTEWETGETISTVALDDEVKKLMNLEAIYDEKKKIYKEADNAYEEQRTRLLNLLMQTGKSKYHVDGIGTISMAIKTSVTVPKDPVSKKELLEYFASLGPELYNSYVTVNSQTLNSYINQQCELDPDFVMPGAGPKKETPELRFRKEK